MTHTAVLYTKEGCCLCDRARAVLSRLQQHFDLSVEEVDIEGDATLYERYRYVVPVVVIDGKHRFESKIAEYYLRRALVEPSSQQPAIGTRHSSPHPNPLPGGEGEDRGDLPWGEDVLITGHPSPITDHPALPPSLGPRTRAAVRAAQDLSFWLARHWLAVANGINLAVLGGSAAVPALMAAGLTWLATPLFGSYRLICHQLPYRSFFLFGYQMAMCERNVAIYGSMSLAGLLFGLTRGRLRPLPWRWYLALSVPIAVDGFTQLFGWRESTWELRAVTGTLFGVATVWLAYPHLERFAQDILAVGTRRRREAWIRGHGDGKTRRRGEGRREHGTQSSEPRTAGRSQYMGPGTADRAWDPGSGTQEAEPSTDEATA